MTWVFLNKKKQSIQNIKMTVISLKSFHKVKHSDEYTGIFIMDGLRRRGCNKYFKYFKIEKWRLPNIWRVEQFEF